MPRPFSRKNKVPVIRRCSLHVLLSYLVCSFVFTYPLVFRLTTHVPGGKGDVPTYIWNLWWMKKALSEGISPLFCDYIFVPYGASLVFHTFVFYKAILAVPLQWLCSAWTTYNILILATFATAGWGMFLLARYLTGDGRAAWIAGLIYAFSPYMLTRSLSHFNCLSSEWIPLYVLCLIRLVETKDQCWAWGGGLCLLLTAYCDYYYLIYLTLFTAFYLGWRSYRDRSKVLNGTFLTHFALMGAIAAIGFAPILWVLFETAQSGYIYGGASSAKLGADLLAFVTPPPGSLLYGDVGAEAYKVFSGGNAVEATVFSGYVVLGLLVVCVLRLRGEEAVRGWLWLALAFFLLSLGPLLHIGGDFVFALGEGRFAVPLPYALVRYVPLIKGARVAARFDIMVMLGLAVLGAYTMRYWLDRVAHPVRWTAAVAALIALEFFRLPYQVAAVEIPDAYAEVAGDHRDVTVMEVPLGWRTGWGSTGRSFDERQLFQTVHGKRLIGGFVARAPEDRLQRMTALPGVGQLLALQEELPRHPSPTAARRPAIREQLRELLSHLPSFLRERLLRNNSVHRFLADAPLKQTPRSGSLGDLVQAVNLGYVFVHPPYSDYAPIRHYLETGLPLEQFYEHDGVIGYRVVAPMDR